MKGRQKGGKTKDKHSRSTASGEAVSVWKGADSSNAYQRSLLIYVG